jgi:hypothetical protein
MTTLKTIQENVDASCKRYETALDNVREHETDIVYQEELDRAYEAYKALLITMSAAISEETKYQTSLDK